MLDMRPARSRHFFGASTGGVGVGAGGSGRTGVIGGGFRPRSSLPVTRGVIPVGFKPSVARAIDTSLTSLAVLAVVKVVESGGRESSVAV